MISVTLKKDEITPHLKKLLKECGEPLKNILGRAGANVLKKHFRARNASSPNKLGGARTNFWSRVAESVNAPHSAGKSIVIPINSNAIAQKVFGGTISAKKAKNLAIPIAAEAYGKSPRVMNNLHFAMTQAGVKLLGRSTDGNFKALYVLKPSVTQRADPKALPPPAAMVDALTAAADIHMRKV